jgi:hypothetical protein
MRQRCMLIVLYEPGRVWQNMETNTYRTLMAELWKHDRSDMVNTISLAAPSSFARDSLILKGCVHRPL